MHPKTTPNYSGTHCSHSNSEQSFDWPTGLLIQSSKLSKFWPASHCEATGVQSRASTPMKRPRLVVPSLLALFLRPPLSKLGDEKSWIRRSSRSSWRRPMRKGVLHMEILDELLAGGQRQKEYSDFVDRYEQGHPSQGYSDQEVLKRYGEVSHAVPSDQYAQAAQEALSKLSPEERAVFVKMLQDRAAARGVTLPGKVAPEPKDLGQVLTDLHKKPGQLRDMLGGDAAQPQQQASGSSPITDILSSPMAKAVLAGIAAMVVKRVVGR